MATGTGVAFGLLAERSWPVRIGALAVGLVLFGVSAGLMIVAGLGNMPWDVLHQGIAAHTPLSTGQAAIILSLLVLLLWIPLHQRIGPGTLANAVVVGVVIDATTAVVDRPGALWAQLAMALGALVLNGFATVLYISPALGPGPRDGLMTGLVARTGRPVALLRSGIEVVVMAAGWALGGRLFIATFLYAFCIGPVTRVFLGLAARVLRPRASLDPHSTD